MTRLARFVVARRWWVIAAWLLLAVVGGFAAPRATAALSYDFGLPGQKGYEANQQIVKYLGTGGANAPVLLVVGDGKHTIDQRAAATVTSAVQRVSPGARTVTYADEPGLLGRDATTGLVVVYPRPLPGAAPYARALPALKSAAGQLSKAGTPVAVTGQDALSTGGESGGAGVLAETVLGGLGALVVLVVVFGSFLALMPLVVAAASILTTFLVVWGIASVTDVSFIVQFLLSLIGLGVAIDYSLLIVTRWREEKGRDVGGGADDDEAMVRALSTAGRSVLFSGITVAVSLAALIAMPVPFLRSVGFTGLLIPVVSVLAALTLLPALLLVAGRRLSWPHRRTTDPTSRVWRTVGETVVAHRWVSAALATVVLLALASPLLGLRLGTPTAASLASTGGPAATAFEQLDRSGIGSGVTQPVEILTRDPASVREAVSRIDGVAGVASPPSWSAGDLAVVDVWTRAEPSGSAGSAAAAEVRRVAEARGAQVGGGPVQTADFVAAVYGNAWWVVLIIVAVTFLLLARALRSVVLPLKALLLNVLSLGAAYGITVLIWQDGAGVDALFGQSASGALTVWVPVAVFAFLFGLSMDYEVFLLSRIREEHDDGRDTDRATVDGVARTGRLVSSAALILFLAFVSLAQVPTTDVKILATALALGIVIDATIVRGVLAPALVAGLGAANWWVPTRRRRGDHLAERRPRPVESG